MIRNINSALFIGGSNVLITFEAKHKTYNPLDDP